MKQRTPTLATMGVTAQVMREQAQETHRLGWHSLTKTFRGMRG